MKLLFDLAATQDQFYGAHGGGEYTKSVLRRLVALKPAGVLGFYDPSRPLDEDVRSLAAEARLDLHATRSLDDLERLLRTTKPVRWFSGLPYYYSGIDFRTTEVVATIHGLRSLEMPADETAALYAHSRSEWAKCWVRFLLSSSYKNHQRREFERLGSIRARKRTFIVPSAFTKSSIIRHVSSISPEEIQVLYSPRTAVTAHPSPDLDFLRKFDLDAGSYILLLSGRRWIKNCYRALAACEQLFDTYRGLDAWPVVVTGGFGDRFPRRWKKRFLFLDRLSIRQLAGLYAGAGVLVYPTLNEGFGYPPVEAMSYGTAVLAAAISAVPEISADGAAYFCPTDVNDIATRLAWFLTSPEVRSDLSRHARKRYAVIASRQSDDLEALCRLLLA